MIRQSAPLQVAMVTYSCVGVSRVTIRPQFARIARWRASASRQTRYPSSPTIGHRVSRKALLAGWRYRLLLAGDCESGGHERQTRHARSARTRSAYARAGPGEAWPRGCSSSGAATRLGTTMATARAGEAGTASLPLAICETGAPSGSSPALVVPRACKRGVAWLRLSSSRARAAGVRQPGAAGSG
jgi:hypothetical protein